MREEIGIPMQKTKFYSQCFARYNQFSFGNNFFENSNAYELTTKLYSGYVIIASSIPVTVNLFNELVVSGI